MNVASGIVVYAVVWFLTLFVTLPIGLRTQDEAGDIAPGTPASAPAGAVMRRKFLIVTLVALAIWAAICATILWSGLTIRDLDVWGRM